MLRKGGDSRTVANMRPNFFSHISIEQESIMKVFFVSLSGCMVSIVICFSVIVLKDRRLSDFWVVREAFFFGG